MPRSTQPDRAPSARRRGPDKAPAEAAPAGDAHRGPGPIDLSPDLAGLLTLQTTVGNEGVCSIIARRKAALSGAAVPNRPVAIAPRPLSAKRTRPRPEPVIQRDFVGELQAKSYPDVYKLLVAQYEDVAKSVGPAWRLEALLRDPIQAYGSLADIAAKYGLTPKSSTVESPAVDSSSSSSSSPVPKHNPPTVSSTGKTVAITPPKPVSVTPQPVPSYSGGISPTVPVSVPLPTPSTGSGTTGTETVFDLEKLRLLVGGIFARKDAPTKQDFMDGFKALYAPGSIAQIFNSVAFIEGFQTLIRHQLGAKGDSAAFLKVTEITELPDEGGPDVSRYKMANIARWTLRHYSDAGDRDHPPPFHEIKSTMSIGLLPPREDTDTKKDKKKSGHTGDRDWNKYGNTGNTFFLLYLDGQPVEKQKFLQNTHWYAEVPFAQTRLWISSDWLDEDNIKPTALRGSGQAVQRALLKLGGPADGIFFLQSLMAHFHNLEVKIPGTVAVPRWHKA